MISFEIIEFSFKNLFLRHEMGVYLPCNFSTMSDKEFHNFIPSYTNVGSYSLE